MEEDYVGRRAHDTCIQPAHRGIVYDSSAGAGQKYAELTRLDTDTENAEKVS